jgi:hypothetical protein
MEYSEEILESIKGNIDYLNGIDAGEVAVFLEAVAESLYDGELLEQVAAALRDVDEGVA